MPAQAKARQEFHNYLDADWKRWMELYPEFATSVGYPGQNRRWTDDSPRGIATRKGQLDESIKQLRAIDRNALPASEQVNHELYRELLETAEGLKGDDPMPFRNVVPSNLWMPLTQMGGVQQGAADTLANMPHQSLGDYEDILTRMEALPKNVEEHLALLQDGLRRGFTPPKITMRDVPKQIADLVPEDPLKSALLDLFNFRNIIEADRNVSGPPSRSIRQIARLKLHDYVRIPTCPCRVIAATTLRGKVFTHFMSVGNYHHLTPQQFMKSACPK
jgi:uncharacterized protein (DUF885 family)